jgi:hypothetical protein
MQNPAMVDRNEFGRVSEWVLGRYTLNPICEYKVVRSCQVGKNIEWEYCEGQGQDTDLFYIDPPDSWVPLNVT